MPLKEIYWAVRLNEIHGLMVIVLKMSLTCTAGHFGWVGFDSPCGH